MNLTEDICLPSANTFPAEDEISWEVEHGMIRVDPFGVREILQARGYPEETIETYLLLLTGKHPVGVD